MLDVPASSLASQLPQGPQSPRNIVGASLLAMVVNDDVGCLDTRGALKSIDGRPAPQGPQSPRTIVGASLLAMVVNDDVGCLDTRGALKSIAGKPAPTGTAVGYKVGA
jgi:hypothetical protein